MKKSPPSETDTFAAFNEPAESQWSASDSAALYGINEWGGDYFCVGDDGKVHVAVDVDGNRVEVALTEIIEGMQERGLEMPVVLRIENLLDHRISQLNLAFAAAIERCDYQNVYRGVFPIKVNQQCHVVEEIASFGANYHHGLEAGSKAELIIALAQLQDTESLIVCNGYKDAEFVDLGLHACQMGYRCFLVLETLVELDIVIARSRELDIKPMIGVRMQLSTQVEGHWAADSGNKSIFGLTAAQVVEVVDRLKEVDMLDCLCLLHTHLGSQIPNIRNIRAGVQEACHYFISLKAEGAALQYLDLGGGLAVDYDGSSSNNIHSMNYRLDEYCIDVVETVAETLSAHDVAHPVLITESGRATVAYSSVLLFNILHVRKPSTGKIPDTLPEGVHELVENFKLVCDNLKLENLQESFNDVVYYQEQAAELFRVGNLTLRERGLADRFYREALQNIAMLLPQVRRVTPELESLPSLLCDIYYGNFSVFQSLPDIWAINQRLPIMPVERLQEKPTRQAILADLTCDCDGKIDLFAHPDGDRDTLPLHPLNADEDYHLAVFLVGAYQETLGDLHNLFGDTNVVSVRVNADGSFDFVREFHGDCIADVLSYVEYNPRELQEKFRLNAEAAVRNGKISAKTRKQLVQAFNESLQGYTYFEK